MNSFLKYWLWLSLLLWALAVWLVTACNPEDKPEKESEESTFRQSEAQYIGAKACSSCHQEIYQSYLQTGKGRAFHSVKSTTFVEDFSKAKVYDSFRKLWYRVDTLHGDMLITEYKLNGRDTSHLLVYQVDYVIGSGNKTRTYLYEENNFVYEMPVTWYVEKKIWDLSPGYENGNNMRFDRPITQLCMSCHNSDFQHVSQTLNKYSALGEGIGCEKCHGPGSLHQTSMLNASHNDSNQHIVNPAKLPIALQFDVCRQCHLEGINIDAEGKNLAHYIPGQPLESYTTILIPSNQSTDDYGFASHAERLQMSKCFINSNEKLTCTTCHDPHKKLEEIPETVYNQKCQNCHASSKGCTSNEMHKNPSLSCVGCHMPKNGTTDIPHVSTSDHYIRIHSKKSKSVISNISDGSLPEMRNFTSKSTPVQTLAKAYMNYFEFQSRSKPLLDTVSKMLRQLDLQSKVKYYYLSKEKPDQPFLDELNKSEIKDGRTLYMIADVHYRNGLDPIKWFERAYSFAPDDLEFVSLYAEALQKNNRFGEARTLLTILLEKKPSHREALSNLGFDYLLHGELEKAELYTKKAIRFHPDHRVAKENLVNIYIERGKIRDAMNQLNELLKEHPNDSRYQNLKKELKKMSS